MRLAIMTRRACRRLRWTFTVATLIAGTVLVPVGLLAASAPPAAAAANVCGANPIVCSATLTSSSSTAAVGSTV